MLTIRHCFKFEALADNQQQPILTDLLKTI